MANKNTRAVQKIFDAAYRAARRPGATLAKAKDRSRVYTKHSTAWLNGWKKGRKSL